MAHKMWVIFFEFYLETTLPTNLPLIRCLNSMTSQGNINKKKLENETSSRSFYGQLSGL